MSDTVASRNIYLVCKEPSESPPCQVGCPVGIDIPRHLHFISQSRFTEALAVVVERLPFPSVCGRVCHAPCELKCRLGEMGGSVPIRALKRFVAEQASVQLGRSAVKSSGKRIAIIGSGPAGLTAAYYLVGLGHAVTVFEMLGEPGGMMRYGIPDYRLPKKVLAAEIEAIETSGVDIRTNTRVNSIYELRSQGYDAVFVAIGAHKSVELGIEGSGNPGVIDAISFLREVNEGRRVHLGDRVVVVGGGDAAVDSARVALRMGARDVSILYRRSLEEMPAHQDQVEEAIFEGVKIEFLSTPSRLTKANGRLRMECIRTRLAGVDKNGRRQPEPIAGSEFEIDVDSVIVAIGQMVDVPNEFGLPTTSEGTIEALVDTLETSKAGVFAGGDAVTGPASVIEAIAAGRKVASSIDRYLGGSGDIDMTSAPQEKTTVAISSLLPLGERANVPTIPVDERLNGFIEVEQGFDEQTAVTQATRCLRCDLPVFGDASKCAGCMTCMLRCSFRFDGVFNLAGSKIQVRRLVGHLSEFEITFADGCDACGICVRYCPYGALTKRGAEEGG